MSLQLPVYENVNDIPQDSSVYLAVFQPPYGFAVSSGDNTPKTWGNRLFIAYTGSAETPESFYLASPSGTPELAELPQGWQALLTYLL